MPKISIITPTYNSSKFIKRTIASVLNQTYTDWEFLIIDDHSTDNTIELINEIAKKEPRIKILKTLINSGGPSIPKNIGIENAKGEYVAFLDHDDEWLPEKLDKQLQLFNLSNDTNLGLVSSYVNIRNNKGELIIKHNENYRGNVIKQLINSTFIPTCSCVMTKLKILKEVGYFDPRFKTADDGDMWLRISIAGYNFDFVPEYLTNYISHENNLCLQNVNYEYKDQFILQYEKYKDIYLKYSLKPNGSYYFYTKKYKLARKYFILSIFSRDYNLEQKIKSFAFILLSFYPKSEKFFRRVFLKIKYSTLFPKN